MAYRGQKPGRSVSSNVSQTEGELIYQLGLAQWGITALRQLFEEILVDASSFENYRVSAEFPKIGRRDFLLNARRLIRNQGTPGMILVAMEDVTTAGS